jgi:hypothetical protein
MFALLHSDINSNKSGFLNLTGQPYCKKCRSAKVKDGIITYFLGTISLIDTVLASATLGNVTQNRTNPICVVPLKEAKPSKGVNIAT